MDAQCFPGIDQCLFPQGGPYCLSPLTGIRSSCKGGRMKVRAEMSLDVGKQALALRFQG